MPSFIILYLWRLSRRLLYVRRTPKKALEEIYIPEEYLEFTVFFFSQSSLKAPDNSSTWYSCLQHGLREGQASLVAKLLLVTGHASVQTTNRLLQKGCHRYLGSADCAWRALWTSIFTPDRKQTRPNPWEQGSHPGGFLTLNALCGCPTIAYSEGLGKERLWPDVVVYINSGSPTRNQLQISIEGFFLSYTQAFPSYT